MEPDEVISNEMLAKKDFVTKKLQQRDDARLQDIEQKKTETVAIAHSHEVERAAEFRNHFKETLNEIDAKLTDSTADLEEILKNFTALQKSTTDATLHLSSYELRNKQNALGEIHAKLLSKQRENQSKKTGKFAFKKSKPVQPKKTAVPTEKAVSKESNQTTPTFVKSDTNVLVENRTGETITLTPEEVKDKDVILTNIDKCRVSIQGNPGAVHVNQVTSSNILCGPCSRSVLLRNATNCTMAFACQQLRLHDASDCDFYIHVTSSAIIEDCTKLRFGPYTFTYTILESHYESSVLDKSVNNWDKVVDFNWLVKDKASPNWRVLSEGEVQNLSSTEKVKLPIVD